MVSTCKNVALPSILLTSIKGTAKPQRFTEAVSQVALAAAATSAVVALAVGVCLRGWSYVESGIVTK